RASMSPLRGFNAKLRATFSGGLRPRLHVAAPCRGFPNLIFRVRFMPDEILLNEAAYAVWQTVKERGPIELGEVAKATGIDQAQVSAAATEAAQPGHFEIEHRDREDLVKSSEA